jgi:hypothetical protein
MEQENQLPTRNVPNSKPLTVIDPQPVEGYLTPKQEKFAFSLAQGMSQADAYRTAYDVQNMTDKTVHEKASRLMADDKVRARFEVLKAEIYAKLSDAVS